MNIDPQRMIDVMKARSAQTYSEMLAEITSLTVYAQALEAELAALKSENPSQPSPFGEQEILNP